MSVTKITSASAPLAISDPSRIEKRPADVEQFHQNLIEGRIVSAQRDFVDLALTDAAKKQEQARLAAQAQTTATSEPRQAESGNQANTTPATENVVESQSHAAVSAYIAANQESSAQESRVSTKA